MNKFNSVVTILFCLAACTSASAKSITTNPAKDLLKAIYGSDDRVETIDYHDQDFQELAASVAVQIADENWQYNQDNSRINITNRQTLKDQIGAICPNEPFTDQIAPGKCTGFLIGPDILVTAGHCVRTEDDCKKTSWFFGFYNGVNSFSKNDVYWCSEVLSQRQVYDESENSDYAVIRLNRKTDRAPLSIRTEGKIKIGTELVMIGHPSGLPQKITDNATVTKFNYKEIEDFNLSTKLRKDYFMTNLDAFKGNSGSPVFNLETGQVEGILVQGRQDYTTNSSCSQRTVYEDSDDAAGEKVLRITKLPKF